MCEATDLHQTVLHLLPISLPRVLELEMKEADQIDSGTQASYLVLGNDGQLGPRLMNGTQACTETASQSFPSSSRLFFVFLAHILC